jgi:hypothetical protein
MNGVQTDVPEQRDTKTQRSQNTHTYLGNKNNGGYEDIREARTRAGTDINARRNGRLKGGIAGGAEVIGGETTQQQTGAAGEREKRFKSAASFLRSPHTHTTLRR